MGRNDIVKVDGSIDYDYLGESIDGLNSQMADITNIKQYQFLVSNWQGTNADWTPALQQAIDNLPEGATLLIPDKMVIHASTVNLKSNVKIKCLGQIIQNTEASLETFNSSTNQNSSYPLFRGDGIANLLIELNTNSNYEALQLKNSHDIYIKNPQCTGNQSNNTFPGILLYNCCDFHIKGGKVNNFGAERTDTATYTNGTGIRILNCYNFNIHDIEFSHNGENGVFTYACHDFNIFFIKSHENGMSGIQVAFGGQKIEQNINICFNRLFQNCADGLDINNDGLDQFENNINIIGNRNFNNGFVNGESTQDGSGIATLRNLKDVNVTHNISFGNNKAAIYLSNSDRINIIDNTGSNIQIVGTNGSIYIENNDIGIEFVNGSFTKADKIVIKKNTITVMLMPNGINITVLEISLNTILHWNNLNTVSTVLNITKNMISCSTSQFNIQQSSVFKFIGNILNATNTGIMCYAPVKGSEISGNTITAASTLNSVKFLNGGRIKYFENTVSNNQDLGTTIIEDKNGDIWGASAPTSGTWSKNEEIKNNNQTEQGDTGAKYVITGWHCTTAGTPGAWTERRALTGN